MVSNSCENLSWEYQARKELNFPQTYKVVPFTIETLHIPDVILITPKVFSDDRGFFEETYKKSEFNSLNLGATFVQDNHSFSRKHTLRGLHFQNPPDAQGKLVRCIKGKILDVAVDLRIGSPYFGKWISAALTDENHRMLWIPEGFAHGFLAMDDSHVEYKVTREYSKDSEAGIIWNDPNLNIFWGVNEPLVSIKDTLWPHLEIGKIRFLYNPGGMNP